MAAVMNELRRMHYLDAMGIDMFVPRKRLPGAAPSQSLPRAIPPSIAAVEAPEAASDVRPMAKLEAISELRPNSAAGSTTPAAPQLQAVAPLADQLLERLGPKPDPAPAAASLASVTPLKPLRFSLSFWHSQGWLVIDTHFPQVALPTETLLHNMLFSLGAREALPKAETLHWPLFNSPGASPGWDAAQEYMALFLRQRLQQTSTQALLVCGAAAHRACLADENYQAQLFSRSTVPNLDLTALVIPSLKELLQQPTLKAQVWQLFKTHLTARNTL